jgi:hypothetical protein
MRAVKTIKHLKATLVGQKVLDGLNRGRQIAIAQAQARSREHATLILDLATADVLAGKPKRGRPGRIARKLARYPDQRLSESQVRRILRALSSVRDSLEQNVGNMNGGSHVEQQRIIARA